MRRLFSLLTTVSIALAVGACQDDVAGPDDRLSALTSSGAVDGSSVSCQSTGTGLSAAVVNQDVVGQTIDVGDCDVGAFFDRDGVVENATLRQPDSDAAPTEQHLVRVEGADVDVIDSEFSVDPDYGHQIIHVGYMSGASGEISRNTLSGFKRVGILLAGAGTSATVKRNDVDGVGEKSSGWAENGIQVSGGATGTVMRNEVTGHWWNLNTFSSAGIIVFGADDVTVQFNTLEGNDLALALVGDGNTALHNSVDASAPDGAKEGVFHYGAHVSGRNNALVQNDFATATSANLGVFVGGGSVNTKLIGNRFKGGFDEEIVDGGEDTKLPAPFEP